MIYARCVISNLAAHYWKPSTVFHQAADFLCSSQEENGLKYGPADKMTDESERILAWASPKCAFFFSASVNGYFHPPRRDPATGTPNGTGQERRFICGAGREKELHEQTPQKFGAQFAVSPRLRKHERKNISA